MKAILEQPEQPSLPVSYEAERAVLSAMLTRKESIPEILSTVTPDDLFYPDHVVVLRIVADLFEQGELIDMVTVSGQLKKQERLSSFRVADLFSEHFSNDYQSHVRTVKDLSRRREILVALQHASSMLNGVADTDEVVSDLIVKISTTNGAVKRPVPLDKVILLSQKRIELAIERKTNVTGIPTGFRKFDQELGGIQPGELMVIGARPSIGKALAVSTQLPTPTGWTTMGAISVGDDLIGDDGMATRVVAVSAVMHKRDCYEVKFSDGTVIVADKNHSWLTETRSARRAATPLGGYVFKRQSPFSIDQRWKTKMASVVTTITIARTLKTGSPSRLNHTIRNCRPWQLSEQNLPIPPYVLGAWLGDGTSASGAITSDDQEILRQIANAGQGFIKRKTRLSYGLPGLQKKLRVLGLLKNKHIPQAYLRASELQRRALLAGLLDTDGTVQVGLPQFCSTNKMLTDGFAELLSTLGYRYGIATKKVNGRHEHSSIAYTVTFAPNDIVFNLTRKAALQSITDKPRAHRRSIIAVRKVKSVPVRCIQVDNQSGLFLASRSGIPTHNSALLAGIVLGAAKQGYPGMIVNAEMELVEVGTRMLAQASGIANTDLRRGDLEGVDPSKVIAAAGRLSPLPVWIYDDIRWEVIKTQIKAMKMHRPDLALVAIDYVQRIKVERERGEKRYETIGKVAREAKDIAKDLRVGVILAAQLNRLVEKEAREPQLSDFREAGDLEAEADVAAFLHCYKPKTESWSVFWLIKKNRNGPLAAIHLKFVGNDVAFYDWEDHGE